MARCGCGGAVMLTSLAGSWLRLSSLPLLLSRQGHLRAHLARLLPLLRPQAREPHLLRGGRHRARPRVGGRRRGLPPLEGGLYRVAPRGRKHAGAGGHGWVGCVQGGAVGCWLWRTLSALSAHMERQALPSPPTHTHLPPGFMSNRGRQNVASFLALDLSVDWRRGADWCASALAGPRRRGRCCCSAASHAATAGAR